MMSTSRNARRACAPRNAGWPICVMVALFVLATGAMADEPFARSKDYDLQHSRIALKFDVEHKNLIGDVSHTLAVLKDDTSKLVFDSVGLTIDSVTLNRMPVKFETSATKLIVPLPATAKKGEKFEVEIKYQ